MTLVLISLLDLNSPHSIGDWGRTLVVLGCGVLIGMSAEVLWSYRKRPGMKARHVRAITASYLAFSALLAYANLFQIGRYSAVAPVTIPLGIVGSALGIVGLYLILRVVSGKR